MAACGGDDSPAPPSGGDGGGGGTGGLPTVRGGERLVWDQRADSLAAARGYTYLLYLDSARSSLGSISCSGAVSAAGYECSGTLPAMAPGRHTLELTVVINGAESPRSSGLAVMVPGASTTTSVAAPAEAETPQASAPICVGESGTECYRTQLVSSRLGVVSGLVATTGNEALFIEDGTAVRQISGTSVVEAPALTLDNPGARVIGIGVPADFEQSRHVYIASSEPGRDGLPVSSVTRYRELQGTLAEGATIVSGLPTTEGASAQMAFDDQGRLYIQVALRDLTGQIAGRPAATTAILRFESDGTVPSDNPRFSPVIAYGYANPSSMTWDPVVRQMWLAGEDQRWSSPVARLTTAANQQASWPASPTLVPLKGDGASEAAKSPQLSIGAGATASAPRNLWVVSAPGHVHRATVQPDGSGLRLLPVMLGGIADVRMVVPASDASLLVVSAPESQPARIWRLEPIQRSEAPSR